MKKLKNLTEIYFPWAEVSNWFVSEFFQCMEHSLNTLQKFKLSALFVHVRERFFGDFISNLKALEEVEIVDFPHDFDNLCSSSLLKLFNNCKTTIKKFTIDSDFYYFMQNITKEKISKKKFLQKIPKLLNLEELNVRDETFSLINMDLGDFIGRHQDSLKILNLSIDDENTVDDEIFPMISMCLNLQSLHLENLLNVNYLKKIFTDSFYQQNSLKELGIQAPDYYFFNMDDYEYIFDVLPKLKNLQIAYLPAVQVSVAEAKEICGKLNRLDLNHEIISTFTVRTPSGDYWMKYNSEEKVFFLFLLRDY